MATRYVAMDVHVSFTEIAALSAQGDVVFAAQCNTTIPEILAMLDQIEGRRKLTFEEGALAAWLARNLRGHVDELVVCEPRRNSLIAREGDKDDPIDARKLADLYRGGYLKPVHQTSDQRSAFKDHVAFYHKQKTRRFAVGNSVLARLRRHGIFTNLSAVDDPERRSDLLQELPPYRFLLTDMQAILDVYDALAADVARLKRSITSLANQDLDARRFQTLPGIGPLRAATFLAYLDTPHRFARKAQLWRYMGIGLVRRHSGRARERVSVSPQSNRRLKDAIIGAAETVIKDQAEPFYSRFVTWSHHNLSRRNARRTLARALAVTLWSMWKTGTNFDPARWAVTS